jgi:3D (Asp-Asp-Asp) domain-containing protein
MKNLVRGGAIMSLVSLFVAIFYAQTGTDATLVIATDSLTKTEKNLSESNIFNNTTQLSSDNKLLSAAPVSTPVAKSDTATVKVDTPSADTKKLVKTTGSARAVGAGASRGAFSATAYCLKGKTAMGHGVRRGIIAADPRVLKLGSTVTINAGQWSGTYLVSDTGGRIKGKKLDIWVPSCSEARKFGRRSVQVFSGK